MPIEQFCVLSKQREISYIIIFMGTDRKTAQTVARKLKNHQPNKYTDEIMESKYSKPYAT